MLKLGIDPEKLYRATFIRQYGLCCCNMVLAFRLFCKNLGHLQEFFGQMVYPPRPPAKNFPYAYVYEGALYLKCNSQADRYEVVI